MSRTLKTSGGSLTILLVILMGVLNRACEFESSETWYEEVSEAEGEIPSAYLNFNDSVIYMDEATLFEYSLSFIKQEVYEVEFYLDDHKIAFNEDTTGSVLLEPRPGIHSFEMVVITSTESGSISDRIGAEAFIYSQSWTIYSETEEASQIEITSVEKADGSLLIEWERYPGYFFQSYELFKKTYEGDIMMCEVLDVGQTSFIDPYFVGGSADYYVRFHKSNFKEYLSDTCSYAIYKDTIGLDLDWEQQNLTISWPRCEFDANFGSYQLLKSLNDSPFELIYSTEEAEDTTLTIAVDENLNLRFELAYHSKMPDSSPGNGVYTIGSKNLFSGSFYLPQSFPAFEVIAQSKAPPYRIYTPEYLYDVVEEDLNFRSLAEYNGLFDVSYNSKRHISGLSYYYGSGDGWTFFGLDKVLSKVPSSVFDNEERRACVASNTLLIIESGSSAYLYAMYADTMVMQFENDSLYWPEFSPIGLYIISADRANNEIDFYYWYWDSSGEKSVICLEWMKSLNGTAGNYVFKNDTEFAMIEGNTLEIRSIEAMKPENGNGDGLLLSTETLATRVVETDPISNTLLTCSSDRLYVYDLTDLRLLGEIPNTAIYQKVTKRGPRQVAYLNSTVFFMEEGASEATMHMLPIEKWR